MRLARWAPGGLRAVSTAGDNQGIARDLEHTAPSEPPRGPTAPRRRGTSWFLPAENPSGAVYGVIVIGALLAGESGRHESYLDTLASAAIATALYWLAHAYAGVLGARLSTGERLTARSLLRALIHDWAVVRGAAIPLFALIVAALAGAAQQTAVTSALWTAVASLLGLELIAGLGSKASTPELMLDGGVGITMGLAILALKIILH